MDDRPTDAATGRPPQYVPYEYLDYLMTYQIVPAVHQLREHTNNQSVEIAMLRGHLRELRGQMQELLRRIPEAGVTVTPKKPPKPAGRPRVQRGTSKPRVVINVLTGEEHASASQAAVSVGWCRVYMHRHLHGRSKAANGYVFRYKDQIEATPQP